MKKIMKKGKTKAIFIVRDGWGYRKEEDSNLIASANTPSNDSLKADYPWTLLESSGEAVGVPRGYQGNSEVGHLTIGAGRVIKQSLKRINEAIDNKSFFKNSEFLEAIDNCKKNGSRLHICGLLQKEGVHSHMDHLFALLDLCKKREFKDVYIHVITDGRDASVTKGRDYLHELENKIASLGLGEVATISGRYYAMDRDERWERTEKSFNAIVRALSKEDFKNPLEKIEDCYKKGETDEFIVPRKKIDYEGVKEGDAFIFFNFRTDRPRQLTRRIMESEKIFFVAMTDYYPFMNARIAFPEEKHDNILGEVLSRKGIKQLRISETEKYAHVTFFFNGQKEDPFKGEDRIMIPSPSVDTYDKKPEMSAKEVGERTRSEIRSGKYDFILVNLVNGDMVGHTGNKEAIIKAIEAVDKETGKIVKEGREEGYDIFVFADHGNAEEKKGERMTSHTTNPVPFILVSEKVKTLKEGMGLKDIAPTLLSLMGIDKPREMTGENIFESDFLDKKGES